MAVLPSSNLPTNKLVVSLQVLISIFSNLTKNLVINHIRETGSFYTIIYHFSKAMLFIGKY